MAISTFNKAKTIVKSLDGNSGQEIIPLFGSLLIGNYPGQVVSHNVFIKNLKAHAKIGSLSPVKLPNFTLEDSETDKLYKTLDIEWNSPRKQLNLFISNNDQANWHQVGAISLLNPAGYPYRIYNLMDLITPNLAIELGDNGTIGIQIQDVGFGLLQTGDDVTIHGSYIQEIILDTGDAVIQNSNDFQVQVKTENTIILAANASRKYLAITNNGDKPIYINLGVKARLNYGIYLTPAGSFELDKHYFGAISAVSVGGLSSVSGIECS